MTQKLLILDVDETLIYATENRLSTKPNFTVGDKYHVYERPFVEKFLIWCFENFEVAVWTSATADYAAEIIAKLFPKTENHLSFVWTREQCTFSICDESRENFFEKKSTKLRRKGYNLKNVIVVDDNPQMWRNSYGNLVRVKPYFGEVEDDELNKLMLYLNFLKNVENVRKVEKRNWRNQY
ncbi:MAG: HAD family hydrolase [Pyrinomonadaceae bacterium]|nr:HAD family hydrolase [Pyrinomonadaceae bacterium]